MQSGFSHLFFSNMLANASSSFELWEGALGGEGGGVLTVSYITQRQTGAVTIGVEIQVLYHRSAFTFFSSAVIRRFRRSLY